MNLEVEGSSPIACTRTFCSKNHIFSLSEGDALREKWDARSADLKAVNMRQSYIG